MPQFRSRHIAVEAFQITPETRKDNRDWPEWLNAAWNMDRIEVGSVTPYEPSSMAWPGALAIYSREGIQLCKVGDWIVREHSGDLRCLNGKTFASCYEPAEPIDRFTDDETRAINQAAAYLRRRSLAVAIRMRCAVGSVVRARRKSSAGGRLMPRAHKRASRGKAKYQARKRQWNEARKARLRREADDARRRGQLAAERDARQRERFERNANSHQDS